MTEQEMRERFLSHLEGYTSREIKNLLTLETPEEIKELLKIPMSLRLKNILETFSHEEFKN